MNFIAKYVVLAQGEKLGCNKRYDSLEEADDVAKARNANVMQLIYTLSESESEMVSYYQDA